MGKLDLVACCLCILLASCTAPGIEERVSSTEEAGLGNLRSNGEPPRGGGVSSTTPLNDAEIASRIESMCPCAAQWENHGDYVSCVAHAARELREHGVISHDQKGEVVSRAAKSSCGRSPAAACPNGLQPNQCGTWDGVELVAEREYPAADDDDHRHHRDHHRDRHGAKHDSGEDTRGLGFGGLKWDPAGGVIYALSGRALNGADQAGNASNIWRFEVATAAATPLTGATDSAHSLTDFD
ncbi:MAG: hypothetical protein IT381_26090 [Deltaproteobacteria bacterium]|nr:hypothetical protein [Deltaproteobacteria bacterium]